MENSLDFCECLRKCLIPTQIVLNLVDESEVNEVFVVFNSWPQCPRSVLPAAGLFYGFHPQPTSRAHRSSSAHF